MTLVTVWWHGEWRSVIHTSNPLPDEAGQYSDVVGGAAIGPTCNVPSLEPHHCISVPVMATMMRHPGFGLDG